jgi:O-antigen ligase
LRVGLELSIEQPLGYGFGNAERILGRKQHRSGPLGTHNDYLRTLLAAGILGFVLYAAGHFMLMRGAVRELRRHGASWVIALLASFQVFCLSGDNDPKETWILLGLITGAMVRRRTEEAKPSTS